MFISESQAADPSVQAGMLGLVVNEAAAFGTPIVSTYGSGAAEEFLMNGYEHFLAEPGNADDLVRKIRIALEYKDIQLYSNYLREKASQYYIERNVECHLKAI
jgi:glycosyltransferase involved in cell wall biosynthesis